MNKKIVLALACSLIAQAVWAEEASEMYNRGEALIARGEQLKSWSRTKKVLDKYDKIGEMSES